MRDTSWQKRLPADIRVFSMGIPSFQPAIAAGVRKNSGAGSYIPKAIRRCSVKPETISKLCGSKESTIRSMVQDGLLPQNFSFSRKEQAYYKLVSLPEDQKFFRIAKLANDLQQGRERAITAADLALVGMVAWQIEEASNGSVRSPEPEKPFRDFSSQENHVPALVLAKPKTSGVLLYGRTAQEWAQAAEAIFTKLKSDVEKAYGYREKGMAAYYKLKYWNDLAANKIIQSVFDGGSRTIALLEKYLPHPAKTGQNSIIPNNI